MATLVYVHGNRTDWSEAFSDAWRAYWSIADVAPHEPFRFIIWSWPAQKVCGLRRDARWKAARTNIDGQYLGWFIAQLDPQLTVQFQTYAEAYPGDFEDCRRRVPDLSRVCETIGYELHYDIDDIIREVVAWKRDEQGTTEFSGDLPED